MMMFIADGILPWGGAGIAMLPPSLSRKHPNHLRRTPMTQISMHAASSPVFCPHAEQHAHLAGAGAHPCRDQEFDPAVYLTLRLAPDMLPFPRQIQIASDAAKACMARLAGQDAPALRTTRPAWTS